MYSLIFKVALCLEVPGNQMGPRGTARNDKSLKSFFSGAAPRIPLALPLEIPALPLETPWRCASKPHCAVPQNPCAAPRNPMVLCLETPGAPRLKTPGDKF